MALEKTLKEQLPRWSYEPHQSPTAMSGKTAADYQCHWEGRAYDLENHVGTGKSRREEETLRIGFAWDSAKKAIVIGYMGQHQRNTMT